MIFRHNRRIPGGDSVYTWVCGIGYGLHKCPGEAFAEHEPVKGIGNRSALGFLPGLEIGIEIGLNHNAGMMLLQCAVKRPLVGGVAHLHKGNAGKG